MQQTRPRDRRTFNAYRHGLTGQVQIRTQSEQVAYDQFCRGIHESLAPVGALENSIVQAVADDRWRLHRAAALEGDIFALVTARDENHDTGIPDCDDALAEARAWITSGKNLQLLGLYEGRLTRHLEKSMAELRRLQAERQAALAKALEEAELLAQLAEEEGQHFDAAEDARVSLPSNFVFSAPEFTRLFQRHLRLARLRKQNSMPQKPQKAPRMAA